ncbi:hypothetical protein V5799_018447, partial [Amblyomma americanum]
MCSGLETLQKGRGLLMKHHDLNGGSQLELTSDWWHQFRWTHVVAPYFPLCCPVASSRIYASVLNANHACIYTCTILDAGTGPR